MKMVKELLGGKSAGVWSVGPDASVYDALVIMAEKNIGALLVMKGDQVVGMMSERDYARRVDLAGHSAVNTKVHEVMSSKVISVKPSETVEQCMELMTDRHFRHLPVMDEGKLLGLVSIGDLVKAVIEEQKSVIGQLENYISGSY